MNNGLRLMSHGSHTTNIAEGFDIGSNKEFIQFLVLARASASEVRNLCYVALENGYLSEKMFENLKESCLKINSLINGFIRYLKKLTYNIEHRT